MSWSLRFDEPIVLPDGAKLKMLREAKKLPNQTMKPRRNRPVFLCAHETAQCWVGLKKYGYSDAFRLRTLSRLLFISSMQAATAASRRWNLAGPMSLGPCSTFG